MTCRRGCKRCCTEDLDPLEAKKTRAADKESHICQLSKDRRILMRTFMGRRQMDIREFYKKDGQEHPGRKGISIPIEQWKIMSKHMNTIDKAIGINDADKEIHICQLWANRKISMKTFKGKILVNIREYYEKDGQELPGRKGISLPLEQWKIMYKHINAINKAFGMDETVEISEDEINKVEIENNYEDAVDMTLEEEINKALFGDEDE